MCTTAIASPKPEKCMKGNCLKTIAIVFFNCPISRIFPDRSG